MFTGIIQGIGEIESLEGDGESAKLRLRLPSDMGPLEIGESVAVDGICLTANASPPDVFQADLSWETISRTSLAHKRKGQKVNLERALRPMDRLGGHFVSGHIDGIGKIAHLVNRGQSWELAIEAPEEILKFCIDKGSIAVDGISLTIATLADSGFTCAVIPHTLNQTNLSERQAGDSVNLEADLIGKYVRRLLAKPEDAPPKITLESLTRAGFA